MKHEKTLSREGRPAPHATPLASRRRILAALLLAQFMSLVSVSVLNVVLPSIQADLLVGAEALQWVLAGYALSFGMVLVASGRAGDLLGRGTLFVAGCVLFAVASGLAGFSSDPLLLNLARVAQGLGSGLLNPQIMGLIQEYFDGKSRARAYGMLGTIAGISVAVGPILGGIFVGLLGGELGWRVTFWINVPLGLGVALAAFSWFPRSCFRSSPAGRATGREKSAGLDPFGALLLALAILCMLLPFIQGRTLKWLWLLLPVGLALLWGWVVWERACEKRGKLPMVDLSLFSIPSFTNGNIIGGLYYLGLTSIWVLVAVYTQQAHGFSALEAGLLGLPSAMFAALASNWAGRKLGAYGIRIVLSGALFALLGLLLSVAVVYFAAAFGLSLWWLLASLTLMGVAQGLIISPNQALTMREVPLTRAGSAGGLMQTFQRVGTSVGIAAMTGVFYASLVPMGWDAALVLSFMSIGVVVLLILWAAARGLRREHADAG